MAEVIRMNSGALHAQVAQRLRSALIEGRIAPGAKLNERVLAEQLQVSRTPLREAIKLLAAEGLVDLLPNRGAVAVQLTEDDVRHSFELLAGLEAMSGRLAAQRASDAQRAEIRAMHYEMMACHTRADLPGYYRLNAAIHNAITDAAANPVLAGTYHQANARVQSLRFRSNQNSRKWAQALAEHGQMVDALDARDADGLAGLLVQHLQHKRDTVLALMASGALALPTTAAGTSGPTGPTEPITA